MLFAVVVFTILTLSSGFQHNLWPLNGIFRGRNYILDPGVAGILEEGGQIAFEHCQRQFQWERWNCPKTAFTRWNTVTEQYPTREVAFIDATISAGITYAVVKNCSEEGVCRTNRTYKANDFAWSVGFEEDTKIGESFSKKYLDSVVSGQDVQGLVNLHNIAVGRQIIRKTMIRKCQCHGVSGTCSLKTCWKKMPSFAVLTDVLYRRYLNAIRIDYGLIGNSASLTATFETLSNIKKDQLIFMQESPDYCTANFTLGIQGTRGRTCSRRKGEKVSTAEKRSCRELCKKCGYPIRKKKMEIKKACNCKFSWCCEVKCDTCMEIVKEYYCH